MSIYRQHRTRDWTSIPNDIAEDERLSWKAKGLMWYLLSRPDHWKPKTRHLATVSTDGRDSVLTGRRELVDVGYLVEERARDELGHIEVVTHVFDTPGHTLADIQGEPVVGFSDSGSAGSGEPNRLVTTEGAKTEVEVQNHVAAGGDGALALQLDDALPARPDRWDEIKAIYPRHPSSGKLYGGASTAAARAAWGKLTADEQDAAIVGAKHYAEACDRPGADRPKHLTTWLNQRCWEDWQEPAAPPSMLPAANGHNGNGHGRVFLTAREQQAERERADRHETIAELVARGVLPE